MMNDQVKHDELKPSFIATEEILKKCCFSEKVVREINGFCSNELKKLSLNVFEFARVYDDRTAIILYSNPAVAKHVVEERIHITAHIPQKDLRSQFWYLPDPNGQYSQLLRNIKEISHSTFFANYIERYQGYFDMYCIMPSLEDSSVFGHIVNKKDDFERFFQKFKENASKLICLTEKDKFILPDSMSPNFGGVTQKDESHESVDLDLFINKIQKNIIKLGSRIYPKLSSKETECIKHLILGKTSPDIAKEFNISSRTVEAHLNSIKNKLNCNKKSQIISSLLALSKDKL